MICGMSVLYYGKMGTISDGYKVKILELGHG